MPSRWSSEIGPGPRTMTASRPLTQVLSVGDAARRLALRRRRARWRGCRHLVLGAVVHDLSWRSAGGRRDRRTVRRPGAGDRRARARRARRHARVRDRHRHRRRSPTSPISTATSGARSGCTDNPRTRSSTTPATSRSSSAGWAATPSPHGSTSSSPPDRCATEPSLAIRYRIERERAVRVRVGGRHGRHRQPVRVRAAARVPVGVRRTRPTRRARRGRRRGRSPSSAVLTAGFVVVFGAFGLIVTPFALRIERAPAVGDDRHRCRHSSAWGSPWRLGRQLTLKIPKLDRGGTDGTLPSMFLFGVSYAVASLSCTIGPFLAVTTSTFRSESLDHRAGRVRRLRARHGRRNRRSSRSPSRSPRPVSCNASAPCCP